MKNLLSSKVLRHWVLNTAIECDVPLTHFFPEVNALGLNVHPVPGCGTEQYAHSLIDLFDSGLITFSSQVSGDDTTTRSGIRRIVERFRHLRKTDSALLGHDGHALKSYQLRQLPGMQVSFKLTPLGGAVWEKVAEPDWAHYVSQSTVYPRLADQKHSDIGEADLISADRDLIIAYMGWYPELSREYIEVETVKWQTHMDYEIVYWKRLPFVYHASFRVRVAETRWRNNLAPKWFQDWWISTNTWYKKPWSLPDWPSE